jgi:V/A-type H+-transporting ATPase subunit E
MGYPELAEALRKEGEEQVAVIRRDAEAEEERIRGEAAAKAGKLREEYARRRTAACSEETATVLAEAANRERLVRLAAENSLADRLYGLARESLPRMREEGYEELFAALAAELPPREWESVRVNPADDGLARRLFPAAEIVADGALTGGMTVTGTGGGVTVVNTLEKRLERGWPELVPELVRAVYESNQLILTGSG